MNGFIGTLYGFGNIMLMMWFGYGGYKFIPFIKTNTGMIASYILVSILLVYLPLWLAGESTRKAAIIGLLPPWVILIIIALPQKEAPEWIMLAGGVIAFLLLTRKPIERYIANTKT